MKKTKTRPASAVTLIEALEGRQLLSATLSTTTTLAAPSSALLGQAITLTAAVKDDTGAAVTGGTVSLFNNGTATGLTAPVNANGQAIFNFGAGNALYAGSYLLAAVYLGTAADASSTSANANLAISFPSFTTETDGLQIATVTAGSGAGAVTGQNMEMLYTGFYGSDGSEFDESLAHSPGTFTFTLNASPEQVIPGFDEGATGMQIGETRVLDIPSALGYQDGKVRLFVIESVAPGSQPFGSAAILNLSAQPGAATATAAISTPITVNVLDAGDNLVQTDSSTVGLSIDSGPAGAVLGGTTSAAAQSGVATFSDVTFSEAGTYTLAATDGALYSAISTPIVVSAPPPSAVAPTFGNVKLPTAVVSGGRLAATAPVVVANSGSEIKGNVTVDLFADTGTTLDGNQVLLAMRTRRLVLKTDKTSLFSFFIKALPASLPVGTYHLLAETIDPSNQTNVIASTQTVSVAAAFVQPTLSIGSVLPSSVAAGKFVSLTIAVTNAGNVIGRGLDITVAPSTDDQTPLAGVILDTLKSGAIILPGKMRTLRLRFRIPTTAPTGNYFPYVSVTLGGVSTAEAGSSGFSVLA